MRLLSITLCASLVPSLMSCANPKPTLSLNPAMALTDSCLWLDRMQVPGTTELGTSWYLATDASNAGLSKIKEKTPAQALQKGELNLNYHLDRGGFQWMPYVHTGFSLPDSLPIAWSKIQGIRYEFKGPEHQLQWQSHDIRDYGWHQKTVKSADGWTTVTIWTQELKQPGWAQPQKWIASHSKGISWSISGKTGDEGKLQIRNIRLLTQDAPMKTVSPPMTAPKLSHSDADLHLPIDSSKWQASASDLVQVSRWPGGKKAAFSLSFDDGYQNQLDVVAPILNQYGIKATFFVIPPMLSEHPSSGARYGSWDGFKALSDQGHEIGAHTMTHPRLSQLDLGSPTQEGSVLYELWQSKLSIEQKISKPVFSIAYPFGDVDDAILKASRKLFIAGRNVNGIVNLQDFDGLNLMAQGLNYKSTRDMQDDLDVKDILRVQILHNVIPSKALGVFFAHEVYDFATCQNKKDSWMPISTETFEPLIRWLAQMQDEGELWVAPMGQTVAYAKERDQVKFGILARSPQTLSLEIASGLPSDVYQVPLDLEIKVPESWHQVQIQGALDTLAPVQAGKVKLRSLPNSKILLKSVH